MNAPVPGWERIISHEPVYIPTPDGKSVAETIWIDVPAWKDPKTGQVFLDGEAREKMESVKARYLGLLTPKQIHDLRSAMSLTQKGIAELMQLGEKTWTRWESGHERPSRSMNVLLCALYDGRIDITYLRKLADPAQRSEFLRWKPMIRKEASIYDDTKGCPQGDLDDSASLVA